MHIKQIKAVVFDIGGTLINEARYWDTWCQWLGIDSSLLYACLGAAIPLSLTQEQVLQTFKPGLVAEQEIMRMTDAGMSLHFTANDLYPDAHLTLQRLHAAGYVVGIAGNQPISTIETLRLAALKADFIGVSDSWGIKKPKDDFFQRVVKECQPYQADEILYVGDRYDNDYIAARACGLQAAWLIRGRWGYVQSMQNGATVEAVFSLDELASRLVG